MVLATRTLQLVMVKCHRHPTLHIIHMSFEVLEHWRLTLKLNYFVVILCPLLPGQYCAYTIIREPKSNLEIDRELKTKYLSLVSIMLVFILIPLLWELRFDRDQS